MPASRPARSARLTGPAGVAAALVLAGALTACTAADPRPEATATAQPTPATSLPVPEPTSTPTPVVSDEPAAAVELTADRVGGLVVGEPVEVAQLEALLGPADRVSAALADCGAPHLDYVDFGDLAVIVENETGTLYGWTAQGPDVDERAAFPHGFGIGTPYADVVALPGAQVEHVDPYQVDQVTAEGISWWFASTDPASPATVVGSRIHGCS